MEKDKDNDLAMCELQHQIDGQQWTIQAREDEIHKLKLKLKIVKAYFTTHLDPKDVLILHYMLQGEE